MERDRAHPLVAFAFEPASELTETPQQMTEGAAGFDLRADLLSSMLLQPGTRLLVPTGLYVAVPQGFELQVRPRSGLALKHGITVLNTPGTVDADYRGEVGVILYNTSNAEYEVAPNERIAQAVIAEVPQPVFQRVQSRKDLGDTARGAGGFGSTGR